MVVDGLGRIPMSQSLNATIARASEYARAQSHIEVTLEHLLLALSEDPDAALVLMASNIDLARLKTDISGHLGRIEERSAGPGTNLFVSADLRRILEASAAAALQGRRREINGAIVLAAVVGDGKSAAAHMLRAQGLTFEAAIRALQRAQQTAAAGPGAPPPPVQHQPMQAPAGPIATAPPFAAPAAVEPQSSKPIAEDALVRARERLQQRGAVVGTGDMPPASSDSASSAEPVPATESAEIQGFDVTDNDAMIALPPERDERQEDDGPGVLSQPELTPRGNTSASGPGFGQPSAQRPASQLDTLQPPPVPPPPLHPHRPLPSVQAGERATRPHPQQPPSAPAETYRRVPEPSRPDWAPPPPPPPANLPPPIPANIGSGGRMPPPIPASLPQRPVPPLPPAMPRRAEAPMAPPQAPMARPARPEPANASPPPRPPVASAPMSTPAPRGIGASSRSAGSVEIGQLVENIPRTMRVAIPVIVEVRVARADVKNLADGLQNGGAAYQHEVMVTKAMSVRLRAPDGGFFIETASPETQWIENVLGLATDDYASWRWSVTPRTRGWKRLQLIVSARTVGGDGLAAETALPDQMIEVRVRTNYGETARQWGGWIAAAIAGGVLAKFGDGVFEAASRAVTRLVIGG